MATYIKPNAIKDASIEGIKIKDGTISSSKIDGTVASKSYVDAQVKTVDDKTVALEARVTNAVQITYSELKSLRDSGKLIPGTQYRITDYTCTTTQANAKSAGHVFDIIVTADDESTLNEEARAALHTGDEYFSGCNLNAWKLWYCLDNDINRFEWVRPDEPLIGKIAPRPAGGSGTYTYSSPIFKIVFKGKAYNLEIGVRTMIYSSPSIYITKTDDYTLVVEDENNFVDDYSGISVYAYDGKGKGVIYRMIDEFGNDVPYDFKNIQFYRQWDATKSLWSTISSDNTGVPCYTFSSLGDNSATSFTDKSLISSNVYSNAIGKYVSSSIQTLNNICFFGNNCYSNTFGNNCYSNTFGDICYSNTFGNNCFENTFKKECEYNTFGNYGYRNAFGRGCQHNIFGNFCHNNTFGNFCHNNTFGNSCGSNTFGDNCNSNTFGNNCRKNTFGDDCGNNTFGNKFNQNTFVNSFQANTFGNECFRNTFRNKCYNNTFGNNFQDNTFGNNFQYNTFGNNCSDIKLASDASATTKYNYYQHNHFGDGCKYIVLKGAETASDSQQVQNYNFAQGLQGTRNAYLTIDGKRNRTYETYISKDTDGTIKESVIADTATKKYVDTELDKCAKRDEANTFIQNQIFANGITFNRTSSGGPRFIDIDNKTIRATLYDSNDSCANIEAAPGGPDTSLNSVLTVMSLSYPLKISGAWTFMSYPTVPGVNIGSSIGLYTSETEETPYIDFYARTGYNGTAIKGITKVLNDNTSITNKEYVDTQVKTVDDKVATLEAKIDNSIQIKYTDLKSLRDAGKLVPGTQYRITDYTCTTTQPGTKSAGHVFDIIVRADSENKLNEEASAIQHEGDTYFANSNFSAWKIWYCLDNDTTRFGWADATNGKGVIYRMIDEFNNDVAYDFKNIQFYRQWDEDKQLWSTISSDNTGVPCYTFSSSGDSSTTEFTDYSLELTKGVFYNVINRYIDGKQGLNNICLFGEVEAYNYFDYCLYVTFGEQCMTNKLEGCFFTTFGGGNSGNYIEYGCNEIYIGNDSQFNHIGKVCANISFGIGCWCNSLGNSLENIHFERECSFNSFGDSNGNIYFGDNCSFNSLGIGITGIYFGNSCNMNTLGNLCSNIKFASDSSSTTKYNYYQQNSFGDGCGYILFKGTETASDSAQVQNYNFAKGLQGTDSAYLTIDGVRNRSYETYISKDTDGTIKESVIAEKIDKIIEISYADLVTLRGSSKLVPGQQYRITDYSCTTTQANTKSAGHQFDIIVTADDESTLNEEARAALHTGDEYFSGCSLNAWKIWYSLDNDTTRFAWADTTNGKGVIYRMIDEFDNECPYDFKNIQFYRQWDSSKSLWGTISSDNTGVPCYAFSSSGNSATTLFTDMSLQASNMVYSNVIGKYVSSNKQTLNNNCFFGNRCYGNTFGSNCYSNTFGNNCNNNTFGSNCYNNTFGDECYRNIFGNECYENTFGNSCNNNTFGNICSRNTFGNYIQESQFGDGVQYFSITTQQMTTSPTSSYLKNYIRWLIVENGVRYVNAYVTGSTSSSSYCQNVRICLGIQGVNDSNRKTFDITSCINSTVNNVYQPTNSQTTNV